MAKSPFEKDTPPKAPPSHYELIEHEISHLKKGSSTRHGPGARPKTAPWILVLVFLTLAWLYLMDPPMHAWYKGEAVRAYLYLHNYSNGTLVGQLVATRILSPDEIATLDRRSGSFQSYYASPEAANRAAQKIVDYMNDVSALHDGRYEKLDPLQRMRCFVFIDTGIIVPTRWDFLDPSVGD
jgi:hypothetical protein